MAVDPERIKAEAALALMNYTWWVTAWKVRSG
jgi:hypothetical protein